MWQMNDLTNKEGRETGRDEWEGGMEAEDGSEKGNQNMFPRSSGAKRVPRCASVSSYYCSLHAPLAGLPTLGEAEVEERERLHHH